MPDTMETYQICRHDPPLNIFRQDATMMNVTLAAKVFVGALSNRVIRQPRSAFAKYKAYHGFDERATPVFSRRRGGSNGLEAYML